MRVPDGCEDHARWLGPPGPYQPAEDKPSVAVHDVWPLEGDRREVYGRPCIYVGQFGAVQM